MRPCDNLKEVRNRIDGIDHEIVKMLSERYKYVKQAAKFKKNIREIQAQDRVQEVILKVRKLAREYGTEPDLVENIYRNMISSFINIEKEDNQNIQDGGVK